MQKTLLAGLSALLVAAFLCPPPADCKSTPWEAHISAGRESLSKGNYEDARQQLDAALTDTRLFQSNDPRLGQTYYCLGQLNLSDQNYGQSKQYFERALEMQQHTQGIDELVLADTLYGLASASEMAGDREMAVILLKRVRDIWCKRYGANSKQVGQVLKPLGIYATFAGDFKAAEDCYRQLISYEEQTAGESSPQAGSALNFLALTLSRTGRYAEAAPLAQRSVEILAKAPQYRSFYEQAADNLAFINAQLGKPLPDIAASNLSGSAAVSSASLSPASSPSPSPSQAQSQAQLPAPPVAPPVSSLAASPFAPIKTSSQPAQLKAVTKAESTRSNATSKVPAPSAVVAQVSVQQIMRPPVSSLTTGGDDFRPWEVNPLSTATGAATSGGDDATRTNWGTISYLANGKLITSQEYEAMLLANEAYELIRQEKYKLACDVLRKALNICPELASAHTNLGMALSQLGDNQEAADQLKQAIALDPRKSAPWINLASTFQIDGQLRSSVRTYGEFIRRFPTHPLAPQAKELAAHLQDELNQQTAVETALGPSAVASLQDYLAFASQPAQVRWSDGQATLKVFIQKPDGTPGFKPEYDGFCRQSFADWAAASGGKVAFAFVSHPQDADIDWEWTDDLSKVKSVAEGGEANITSSGKQLKHASIKILTASLSADSPLSPNQARAVCLHEIGHSLGLVGHSPQPHDIMYCSMPPSTVKPALSPRDIGTLKRLLEQGLAAKPQSIKSHPYLALSW